MRERCSSCMVPLRRSTLGLMHSRKARTATTTKRRGRSSILQTGQQSSLFYQASKCSEETTTAGFSQPKHILSDVNAAATRIGDDDEVLI
uniref:Uncharacterized protein n=1 Tax=Triticum urartu TaxID=4572 RepID=A0A8R7QY27_TRIUA